MEIKRTFIDDIPEEVFEELNCIGVPCHLKGYNMIAYAITLLVEDPRRVDQITKTLYPSTSKQFEGSTPASVERGIRHAICRVCEICDQEILTQYFGNSTNVYTGKITNTQFLYTVARIVRKKLLAKS